MIKFVIKLIALYCFAINSSFAFNPQTGVWVVDSELNGKPGRGIALDIQNNTIVAAIYAYDTSGQSTFYFGAGLITHNQSGPSVSTMELQRYANGRYFGSSDRSGSLVENSGIVRLEFTSGITGYVIFPGEEKKAISRFQFGYGWNSNSLFGAWAFTSYGSKGVTADVVVLSKILGNTQNGNGVVSSSDNTFGCEHQIAGSNAWSVLCVKVDYNGNIIKTFKFFYSVNDGEGLSGTANSLDQGLIIRRIANQTSNGTGILFRADQSELIDASLLINALNSLVVK